MAIEVEYLSGSPYAWRVFLSLEHKRLPYQSKLLSYANGDTQTPAFTALNPRGKVPVLHDGNFVLYESSAIVAYLEDRYPETPLFPGGPEERALQRRMIAEADSYLARYNLGLAVNIFYHPPEAWDRAVLDRERDNWLWDLGLWEGQIRGDYLAGELSAADFTVYPFVAQVARMETKATELGIIKAMGPKLTAWKARIEALPYFKKTWPPAWK